MSQLCASEEWCVFIGHEYITLHIRAKKKLKFMMEINRRVDRQKFVNLKVIFDLLIFCFYFIQQKEYKLYYANFMIILKFRANVHIGFVTAQSSEHLHILATTPYWPNNYS